MQVLAGRVVDGKVVLDDASLPDGVEVCVVARSTAEFVSLPPHLQTELDAALDEAEGEEGMTVDELFRRLRM